MAIFEAAIQHRVRRVVFSSTAFAYGWAHDARDWAPQYLPLDEDHPLFPTEHYGLSKLQGEQQIDMLLRAGAIGSGGGDLWADGGSPSFAVLRFPNSIWRDFWHLLPWPRPASALTSGTCYWGGPIMWAYVHEDDVIDAHLKCLDIPEEQLGSKRETFVLAADDSRIDAPTMELVNQFWMGRQTPHLKRSLDGCASILSNEKAR